METDDIWDQPQFKNEPMYPPREDVIGEMVFYSAWKKFMADDGNPDHPFNYMLSGVLSDYAFPLTERAATVAATVVVWLGCNMGRAVLAEGRKLSENVLRRETAYVQAWAAHTVRKMSVNGGYRTLERLLMPPGGPLERGKVSLEDYEVAEQVMHWLGGKEGQRFLAACEAEIARQESVRSFESHLRTNLRLKPEQANVVLQMAETYSPTPVPFVR